MKNHWPLHSQNTSIFVIVCLLPRKSRMVFKLPFLLFILVLVLVSTLNLRTLRTSEKSLATTGQNPVLGSEEWKNDLNELKLEDKIFLLREFWNTVGSEERKDLIEKIKEENIKLLKNQKNILSMFQNVADDMYILCKIEIVELQNLLETCGLTKDKLESYHTWMIDELEKKNADEKKKLLKDVYDSVRDSQYTQVLIPKPAGTVEEKAKDMGDVLVRLWTLMLGTYEVVAKEASCNIL
eukprot:GHVL01011628.1.p1 GENE.GHVL01011628.1~~GHVL01011628.1.p1  ORF type:complete len:239 (+),score=40.17 GHVL01011628.1:153-869(+)